MSTLQTCPLGAGDHGAEQCEFCDAAMQHWVRIMTYTPCQFQVSASWVWIMMAPT